MAFDLFVIEHVSPVFYKLVFMSLSAVLIAGMMLIIRHIFDKKIPPMWKYLMWGLVIAALVVPYRPESEFSLTSNISKLENISFRQDEIDSREEYAEYKTMMSKELEYNTKFTQEELEAERRDFDRAQEGFESRIDVLHNYSLIFQVVLPTLWIVGIAIYFIVLLIGNHRLSKNISGHVSDDRSYKKLLEDCKHMLCIKKDVEIVVQDYISSPALIGIIKPKIILPEYVKDMEDKSVSYIILHELAHLKKYDIHVNFLMIALRGVYWFNPLILKMFKYMREDMEVYNDSYVAKYLEKDDSKDYARSLVEVLGRSNKISFMPKLICMVDDKNNVERRISMLKLKENFGKNKILASIFCIFAMALLFILFFTQMSSNLTWALNLQVADVEKIELFIPTNNEDEQYMLFSEGEFDEIVSLINKSAGNYVSEINPMNFGSSHIFYVETTDEKVHEIAFRSDEKGIVYLFIDGDAYEVDSNFENEWMSRNFNGNAPLPPDFHVGKVLNTTAMVADATDIMYENRTKYLGDNSAVGNILSVLPITDNSIVYDGFTLKTDDEPYRLTVYFNTDAITYMEYENNWLAFEQSGEVLFSLIENVDEIRFVVSHGNDESKIGFVVDMAREVLEEPYGGNLYEMTETKEDFEELLDRIYGIENENDDVDRASFDGEDMMPNSTETETEQIHELSEDGDLKIYPRDLEGILLKTNSEKMTVDVLNNKVEFEFMVYIHDSETDDVIAEFTLNDVVPKKEHHNMTSAINYYISTSEVDDEIMLLITD